MYQVIEANAGLFSTAQGDSGGVAFSAHVGGFVFGFLVARLLDRMGYRVDAVDRSQRTGRR